MIPSPPSHSSPVRGRRTFRAAVFFLALIAAAQAVAAAAALRRHHQSAQTAAAAAMQPAPGGVARVDEEEDPFSPDAPALVDLSLTAADSALDPEKPVEPETENQNIPAPEETVMARPRRAAPLDVPITNEACLQHLDEGIYLKEKGDMQGALEQLRAALALQPEHPRLVFHLASTLELMGLDAKARTQWGALRKMGAGAGDYHDIAVYRLQGGEAEKPGAAPPESVEEEKEGRLVFAGIESRKAGSPGEGEVRTFRLSIERRQAEPVDVSKLSLAIHFFDEVNGRRIDRSTTVQPQVEWETGEAGFEGADDAVDWTRGSESGGFEYRQPLMTADDVVRFGRRKYLGYVVEMFYDGKLQDVSASVPQLLDFARELPVDESAGGLDDAAAPVLMPGQPDNALFPGDFLNR